MNGRRYVVDVRQSWSKYDKPCKIYIVSRMYTEEEYKMTFPHKYKKGKTFKQGQLYKKESEYSSTKQHEVLLFLVRTYKGGYWYMADANTLTEKERIFADEYIKTTNATQSAIKAGYSEKTASSKGT